MKKLASLLLHFFLNIAMADTTRCIPDLSRASPPEAAEFMVYHVNDVAPNSYTRNIVRKPAEVIYSEGEFIRIDRINKTREKYVKEVTAKITENYDEYGAPAIQAELFSEAAIKARCADCGQMCSSLDLI